MNWRNITIIIIFAIIISIATWIIFSPPSDVVEEEGWVAYEEPIIMNIGGKYNSSLFLIARLGDYESGDIIYTKDGIEKRGYYVSAFKSALEYLRDFSSENSKVLSWWDYGNMIIGFAEREVIATNPSESILISVTNNTDPDIETDPDEIIFDIAKALHTDDPNVTISLMNKYGIEYVFVPTGIFGDEGKAKWIFFAAGVNLNEMDEYWIDGRIVEKGIDTILFKMLNSLEIEGFNLAYSDKDTRIYKLST